MALVSLKFSEEVLSRRLPPFLRFSLEAKLELGYVLPLLVVLLVLLERLLLDKFLPRLLAEGCLALLLLFLFCVKKPLYLSRSYCLRMILISLRRLDSVWFLFLSFSLSDSISAKAF